MATWKPDGGRMAAIERNKAWYTGKSLDSKAGVLFWTEGTPTTSWTDTGPVKRESRIHVPVAADLALTAADFLFGAGLNITADSNDNDKLLDELKPGLQSKLTLAADRASGIGETYLRLGWEMTGENDGRAFVSLVDAGKVSPTWHYGRMTEAVVRHPLPDYEGKSWVHYETYRPGTILHELYLVDPGEREVLVPLSRHPETLDLVLGVRDDDMVRITDDDRLAMTQLVVELPGPLADAGRLALIDWLNKDPRDDERVGGAADTEGSETLMGMVDQAITSLDRDIRLGRARIIVDENMLNRNTEHLRGIRFDTTAEIFAPIQAANYKGELLQIVQFDIRAEAHLSTARDAIRKVVQTAGYSPESLVTEESHAPEAAAARRLKEARSLRTTGSKWDRIGPKVTEALQGLMVIQASLRNQALDIPELTVEIREAISPDLAERALLVTQLTAARVMARKTGIQTLHPDWDEKRVQEELDMIANDGPDTSLGGLL